jgi:hypothetical protein
MKKHGFLWLALVVLAAGILGGCGDVKEIPEDESPVSPPTSITVSPERAIMAQGQKQQFNAYNKNGERITASWTLSGSTTDSGTTLDKSGILFIGGDEKAETLTVKASVSGANPASATVAVLENGGAPAEHGITVDKSIVTVEGTGPYTDTFKAYPSAVGTSGAELSDVTWTLSGSMNNASSIDAGNGTLTVGDSETAKKLVVKAAKDGLYGTALVYLNGGQPPAESGPVTDGLTIDPQNASVARRGRQTFVAKDSGGAVSGVTWRITGNSARSTITNVGELKVAANETATVLTVRAERTNESGDNGTAVVALTGIIGWPLVDRDNPSIKAKFGVEENGEEGVENSFLALSAYIKGQEFGATSNAIKLGDYIDLEGGLSVAAYNDAGGFTLSAEDGLKTITTDENATSNPNYSGKLLRLIVVGINSFKDINGNDATPHVVFQFQNIPVLRRMMPTNNINKGGYAASEMREYLSPVSGKDGSGKFLAGLKDAGVPETVLWAPRRAMVAGYIGEGFTTIPIEDMLWLPTEWEMFGRMSQSNDYTETDANEGRLDYYHNEGTGPYPRRVKYYSSVLDNNGVPTDSDGKGCKYWEASLAVGMLPFCAVVNNGSAGDSFVWNAEGCAPAFCVK